MGDYEKAAAKYLAAKEKLAGAIIQARREGTSWTEIGRPLGISKQAAQQKFGGMVTLAIGMAMLPEPASVVTGHSPARVGAYDAKPRHDGTSLGSA